MSCRTEWREKRVKGCLIICILGSEVNMRWVEMASQRTGPLLPPTLLPIAINQVNQSRKKLEFACILPHPSI